MKRYIKSTTVDLLDESVDLKLRIAKDPKSRPSMLSRLVNASRPEDFVGNDFFSSYGALMYEIAKNPNTPDDALRKLVDDPELQGITHDVRYAIVNRENLPEDIAKKLATCDNGSVRKELAQNKTISPDVFRILAKDELPAVVYEVAQNPNIPEDVVQYLLNIEDPDMYFVDGVLGFLVQNPNVTADGIAKAFNRCSKPWMICRIANNPNVTPEILDTLIDMYPFEVLEYFKDLAPDILTKLSTREELIHLVARHPKTPIEILRRWAADNNYITRIYVARNQHLPEDLYMQLANDASAKVRLTVAENIRTPKVILKKLEQDPSERVRRAVRYALRRKGE